MDRISSSSQRPLAQRTTEQEIEELEDILAKIQKPDGNITTIDVTSKQLSTILSGLFENQDAILKDSNLRNNFCRFDIQQYNFSPAEKNLPRVHYRSMMASACSCHSAYRSIAAAGDCKKMESFINFSDFSRVPDTHTLNEMTPWYTRLKDMISNHSDDAATAASSACSHAGGAVAISAGLDPKTTKTGMAMLSFLAEKGFKQAILTLGQCPNCGDQLSKYKERALKDPHYFKQLEIADEEIRKGIDHLKKIVSRELDAKKHISKLEKKLKDIESRYEGYKTHSKKLTEEKALLEGQLRLFQEELTQEAKTERRAALEEQITHLLAEESEKKEKLKTIEREKTILEEEIQLAEMHRAQLGTLIDPLTMAGSAVPPRLFDAVLQRVLAIEAIPMDTIAATCRSEITYGLVQIQEITQSLSGVDPSIIRAAMRADFRELETGLLEELQKRLFNIRQATQRITAEAHKQIEDRQKGEGIDAALVKAEERGRWIAVLPSLITIHDELRALIHDRKLAEKETTIRQQKEENQELSDLATQQAERIRALEEEVEKARRQSQQVFPPEAPLQAYHHLFMMNRLQNRSYMEALRSRIDTMGFKCTEDHRSPAFKQEITYRIETMIRISDFLQPFDGLLQNGPTGRRTSFVQENATFTLDEIQELLTEYRRAFNPVLADERSFLENLVFMKGAHSVISDVVIRDKRNSYPITTRLGLEDNDGYLDIFAEAMEENNIWG